MSSSSIFPALELVGGAAATAATGGAASPIGLPLMVNGATGLIGSNTGNSSSSGSGGISGLISSLGGLAGGTGGMSGSGFSAPGANGTPSLANIGSALSGNPALAGITPGMVTGVSPMDGPSSGNGLFDSTTADSVDNQLMDELLKSGQMSGASQIGQMILGSQLAAQLYQHRLPPAAAHTSPVTQMPGFRLSPYAGGIAPPGQY